MSYITGYDDRTFVVSSDKSAREHIARVVNDMFERLLVCPNVHSRELYYRALEYVSRLSAGQINEFEMLGHKFFVKGLDK